MVTEITIIVPVYDGEKLRRFLEPKPTYLSSDQWSKHRRTTFEEDFDRLSGTETEKLRQEIEWMSSQNSMLGNQAHVDLLTEIMCSLSNLKSVIVDVDEIESQSWDYSSLAARRDKDAKRHPLAGGRNGRQFTNGVEQAKFVYAARGCQTVLSALKAWKTKLEKLQILPMCGNSLALPALADALPHNSESSGLLLILPPLACDFATIFVRNSVSLSIDKALGA